MEAVVAEEEDEDEYDVHDDGNTFTGLDTLPLDISAGFAEHEQEEFSETTTGSTIDVVKQGQQDSDIFGNYDSSLFEDTDYKVRRTEK